MYFGWICFHFLHDNSLHSARSLLQLTVGWAPYLRLRFHCGLPTPSLLCAVHFSLHLLVFAVKVNPSRVISLLSERNFCSALETNGTERNWSCRSNYAITLTLHVTINVICLLHCFSENSFDSLFWVRSHLPTDTVNKKMSNLFTCNYLSKVTSIGS
jgi:hypothetical protein